ncbi:FtsW/RodA/SpoVE family cell cycle protein [Peribacillus sp. SCS-26]|uniref:FtsW/RodA/SpoVE family cell cycle protein n=1 Tax=Paraperibacillus marinus TaxID=3115295 RepID=UPI0039061B4E
MKSMGENFLEEVLDHIKSKEAKILVEKELSCHLNQSKNEWITQGWSQAEAEEKAVMQMGSASKLGIQFNKLHRPKVDWLLLFLFAAAIGMGFLPVLSPQDIYPGELIIHRQALFVVISVITALAMMFFDYRKLHKFSWIFLACGIALLYILAFHPNASINGRPYIIMAGTGISISGITALPFLFLFWASYFSKSQPKFWLVVFTFLTTIFLFMLLPNLPVIMIYSILVFMLFWGSSVRQKIKYMTAAAAALLSAAFLTLFWFTTEGYQKLRILSFLNPGKYSQNEGFQYLQVKKMMSSGGWSGAHTQELSTTDMLTDFVFVNITYHYGWITAGLLVLILLLLAVRMVTISRLIKDRFGRQLVLGVISLFSVQFLYNVGMTLGLFPFISISLPFISHGLTPALLNSFLIGVALSVYRRKNFSLGKHSESV